MASCMEKPAIKKIVEIDGKKLELWVPNFRLGKKKAIEAFSEWAHGKWTKEEIELGKKIRAQLRAKKKRRESLRIRKKRK